MQREYKISLSQEYYSDVVYLSQYDDDYDVIFHVINKYSAADVGGKSAKFTGTRSDGLGFTFTSTAVGSSVSFHINTSLTACAGTHTAEIVFYDSNDLYFGSANVQVIVEKAAHPDGTIDADEEALRELAEQVQEIVDTAAAEVKGEAESWAVGERDGEPVSSDDPTYENNAKYYSQQAAQIAEDISGVTDQVATNTSDISDLKEDLNAVEDILKATKKHLNNVYIASNGVISAGGTYDTVCFQVIAGSLIDISNTDTVLTYAFYVSEPTIDSVSYNNSRSYVNSGSISNVEVPTGCAWIAIRTNHLGDASISPKSLLEILKEASFKIPKTTDAIIIPANTDLNNITANGLHYLNGLVYDNSPFESGQYAFLLNYCSAVLRLQICIGYNSTRTKIYVRDYGASNWNSWKDYDSSSTILEKAIVPESTGLAETDLNNVFGNHVWLMTDSYTYTNKPPALTSNAGFLIVADVFNGWTLQLLYSFTGGMCWKRRGKHGTTPTWEQWEKIGGGIENNYTFNEYNNAYEVTATPSITTDTNNYLASTGDTTDVTASIVSMLETNKVCRLGTGVFYVNNLAMPDGTEIIGSGASTQIILAGSSDGFAVKMGSRCIISDLMISGSTSDIVLSGTVGNRHGILWQGNYTADNNSNHQPQMSIINNVYINHFTGGAVTCHDTGFGTYNHLEVTNAFIYNCNAGINISYWSEFHKFTNVRTYLCYYGCVNNGGNNTFVNCDFSKCTLAFLMDNSQNQSPNNSHGSAIGCVFNHTDNNTGTGIKILNCDNGFVFSGCQIFFSQIYIKDSDGVTISNSNFGSGNCDITIDGGGVVMFIGNLYGSAPTITITNNNSVHFANCYVRSTGAVVGQ